MMARLARRVGASWFGIGGGRNMWQVCTETAIILARTSGTKFWFDFNICLVLRDLQQRKLLAAGNSEERMFMLAMF